ncbi:NeuD/PglB/VioB family sugar acetyltransferase [Bernardetia sp.]|uniref:NeuD/PglB/VioB family sugar acetyltransferase n=1 Tax=Bernardetia sp. TaxID=1937974 RepID=UPI0025B7FB6D|nr:NeuD/PglB/VioB family sugar acetyltransferase [Bernardetia sp.]
MDIHSLPTEPNELPPILPLIIVGAKGLGKVALEVLQSTDNVIYCFLDEEYKEDAQISEINHVSIMGSSDDEDMLNLINDKCDYFVAIENSSDRKRLIKKIHKQRKKYPAIAVHSTAHIADDATMGYGTMIGMGTMIGANAKIGTSCIIGANATLDYDVEIANFTQIGIGANIGAGVKIEEDVFIGNGVTIIAGVTIGKGARVGAGSVVLSNIKAKETVLGNPAKAVSV